MIIHAIAHGIDDAPRGPWLVHLTRYEENLIWRAGHHPDCTIVNRNDLPSFGFRGDWKISQPSSPSYCYFSYIPFEESHFNGF